MKRAVANNADSGSGGQFLSTRWSVVLAAGGSSEPDAQAALAELCRCYWFPLYSYVRRRVPHADEAQDLIQEFFTHLLEKNTIAVADQQRGRFRAFLLTALRNFLANEWTKSQTRRRGGGHRVWQLDLESGESLIKNEPLDVLTPEKLFDRRWAETLLKVVMNQLQDEFERLGKSDYFDQLKPFLTSGRREVRYEPVARQLGISEGAAMVAAHRMRRRFRDLLRAEIAQTVPRPEEVDDEIHDLFKALSD